MSHITTAWNLSLVPLIPQGQAKSRGMSWQSPPTSGRLFCLYLQLLQGSTRLPTLQPSCNWLGFSILALLTIGKMVLCQGNCFVHGRILSNIRLPGGSDCKESACSAEDQGLIPGSGRSPGEENGYPLQYSCLENSMDRGAWWTTVHGIAESDMTEPLTLSAASPSPCPHQMRGAAAAAAAAAESLQSCPTLCDPIDGSPPGSTIPGILQARTLEWVAISFSNAWKEHPFPNVENKEMLPTVPNVPWRTKSPQTKDRCC